MGTGTNQYKFVIVIFKNKQPIRLNKALTSAHIIACQLVILEFFIQWLTLNQLLNNLFVREIFFIRFPDLQRTPQWFQMLSIFGLLWPRQ